jgi:tetratricopeptide (TPR) repeat protein
MPSLNDALRLYRRGDFEDAAEKYKTILKHDRRSADAHAGLARSYLKAGKVRQAYETVEEGLELSPDSQTLRVVRGEIYFRQGKMHGAEQEFLGAVNSDSPDARAYLGLARISESMSLHARARRMLERAHELDPTDPEIEWRWLTGLERSSRVQALAAYIAAARASDVQSVEEYKGYLEALKKEETTPTRECTLMSTPVTMRTFLWPLFTVPPYISGYGPEVRINERQFRLLLDTGASGILLNPRAAERAGIIPAIQSKMVGIGDKGDAGLYVGYADSVRIGSLEFKNCPVQVSAKEAIDQDGLIGADLFAHYLVTIDYPAHELRLSQLPQRTSGPSQSKSVDGSGWNAEDRYIPLELRSYTPIYRFGHLLLVPTVLNEKVSTLFLIDSGSDHNYISPDAAREVTKLEDDKDTHVLGVKGRVKNVFRASKATLSFGRYKQENEDLIAFDLSKLSEDAGTEISGTLGFSLLRILKVTIDYRDGLVDFSYDSTRVH